MSISTDRYLLDTNAAIALLKGQAAITALTEASKSIFLSVVTVGELYFGAERSGRVEANRKNTDAIAEKYVVLYMDNTTAQLYGRILQSLRSKGRPIPQNDVWIAAIALQHNLTLLTRDVHFKAVDNLPLATW